MTTIPVLKVYLPYGPAHPNPERLERLRLTLATQAGFVFHSHHKPLILFPKDYLQDREGRWALLEILVDEFGWANPDPKAREKAITDFCMTVENYTSLAVLCHAVRRETVWMSSSMPV